MTTLHPYIELKDLPNQIFTIIIDALGGDLSNQVK